MYVVAYMPQSIVDSATDRPTLERLGMSTINKIADRVLTRLVGTTTASAGCAYERFTRYESHAGMRCWRICEIRPDCKTYCGGLNCPV